MSRNEGLRPKRNLRGLKGKKGQCLLGFRSEFGGFGGSWASRALSAGGIARTCRFLPRPLLGELSVRKALLLGLIGADLRGDRPGDGRDALGGLTGGSFLKLHRAKEGGLSHDERMQGRKGAGDHEDRNDGTHSYRD